MNKGVDNLVQVDVMSIQSRVVLLSIGVMQILLPFQRSAVQEWKCFLLISFCLDVKRTGGVSGLQLKAGTEWKKYFEWI